MAIIVICEHCSETLKVADDMAGKRGMCPHCKGMIDIAGSVTDPAPQSREPPRELPPPQTVPAGQTIGAPTGTGEKECPMCGETIKAIAKRCKHCRALLDPASVPETSQQPTNPGTTCPECRFEFPFLEMIQVMHTRGRVLCPHCKANLIFPDTTLLRVGHWAIFCVLLIPMGAAFWYFGAFSGSGKGWLIGVPAVLLKIGLEIGSIFILRNQYYLMSLRGPSRT